jgi:benzylsuccinate CoA-transferase BbsF subunit
MFVLMNANKLSVSINLATPQGVELVERLVAWADVVSENFSPKVMAKWGLDYERLRKLNPELVMLSGCLFGQTGPQRMYPGFGGQGSAISGFNHLTGWPDREAIGPHGTITDSLSPRYVALGLAAALLQKKRTGKGRYLDVSQIETAVYSLSELIVRYSARAEIVARDGNRCERAAPHGVYPCAGEDRWIAIAVFSDAEWQTLATELDSGALNQDARFASAATRLANQDALDAALADATRNRDAYALMERLQAAGVGAGVVQDYADLLRDPGLAPRGHFQKLEHAHLGKLDFENYALRFSDAAPALRTPGPNLGEHNDVVLGDLLGMSRAEIAALIERGVIA